jgi:hypothetical protein
MVVNLGFLDRIRYFFLQVAPLLSSRGWVDLVPDLRFLRKCGSPGNRTRDLWICSQKLWPLDHRGGSSKISSEINGGRQPCRHTDLKNEAGWVGFDSWHGSWDCFTGVKKLKCQVSHLPPSVLEAKNVWSLTFISPHSLTVNFTCCHIDIASLRYRVVVIASKERNQ